VRTPAEDGQQMRCPHIDTVFAQTQPAAACQEWPEWLILSLRFARFAELMDAAELVGCVVAEQHDEWQAPRTRRGHGALLMQSLDKPAALPTRRLSAASLCPGKGVLHTPPPSGRDVGADQAAVLLELGA
jgi:hypothetical protein